MSINTFKLEEYLGKYEFSAPYLLCCSDVETYQMQDIIAMANENDKQLWNELKLGYTEVRGLPLLRQTIVQQLYASLQAEDIFCFAGAEEGIFATFYAMVSEKDHIIVLTPCYQSLVEISRLKGAQVTEVALQEKNEWRVDLEKIKNVIQENTKFIVINFPHNPTGQVIRSDEMQQLIDLCKEHDLWLFSDEVYRLLGTPQEEWVQPAAELYKKAISLGVMSKAFGMAGLRVGWIVCQNEEALEKIEKVKHYLSICNSAPAEIISLIALKNKDYILERNNRIVSENLKLLDQFMEKYNHLFSWVRPEGGCIGFVQYKGSEGVEHFANKLIKEKGVLLLPATTYNYQDNYFRIGFGRQNMPEALVRLEQYIKENIKIRTYLKIK